MKTIRNLIAAIALIAITVSVSAQAFVTPSGSFSPISAGNSVWPTKSDLGKPAGTIYARGFSTGFASLIEWFSLGGDRILWKVEAGHLALTSFASSFPQGEGFYLCMPPGIGRPAIQIRPLIGANTVVYMGILRCPPGSTIVVPLFDGDLGSYSGFIEFPGINTAQVQFRLVRY